MPYPISQAHTAQPRKTSQKKSHVHCSRKWLRHQRVLAIGWRSQKPLVASLEIGYLTLCFFASNSIALLNSANKMIALSFDDLPIVVGQFAPLLLGLADELLPVSFHLVGVHLGTFIHEANPIGNSAKSFGVPFAVLCIQCRRVPAWCEEPADQLSALPEAAISQPLLRTRAGAGRTGRRFTVRRRDGVLTAAVLDTRGQSQRAETP